MHLKDRLRNGGHFIQGVNELVRVSRWRTRAFTAMTKFAPGVFPISLRPGDKKRQQGLFYPSSPKVLSSRFGRAGGRAGGCQTCGTHISVTAWRIFSIRSSMELSRPVVVHCRGNLPICPIWACPWAKNLSNLPQIGSRLCGTHISETAGWIYPI